MKIKINNSTAHFYVSTNIEVPEAELIMYGIKESEGVIYKSTTRNRRLYYYPVSKGVVYKVTYTGSEEITDSYTRWDGFCTEVPGENVAVTDLEDHGGVTSYEREFTSAVDGYYVFCIDPRYVEEIVFLKNYVEC